MSRRTAGRRAAPLPPFFFFFLFAFFRVRTPPHFPIFPFVPSAHGDRASCREKESAARGCDRGSKPVSLFFFFINLFFQISPPLSFPPF